MKGLEASRSRQNSRISFRMVCGSCADGCARTHTRVPPRGASGLGRARATYTRGAGILHCGSLLPGHLKARKEYRSGGRSSPLHSGLRIHHRGVMWRSLGCFVVATAHPRRPSSPTVLHAYLHPGPSSASAAEIKAPD